MPLVADVPNPDVVAVYELRLEMPKFRPKTDAVVRVSNPICIVLV